MTIDDARSLLDRSREDYGGKDPGSAMLSLRTAFERATPQEREILNEVVREWLSGADERDRFDGAFITGEFGLTGNLDLIQSLLDEASGRDDPGAPFERARYERVVARLTRTDSRYDPT
jgi:hypothetical protein